LRLHHDPDNPHPTLPQNRPQLIAFLKFSSRQLFIKTDYLGELVRKELKEKVRYAFIHGSFARGEEKKESDIDLFVIGEILEDELIRIIQRLEKKTSREINYILWDEKTFLERAKNHHLLKTIKKSKIIMLIGEKDEFRKEIR